MSVRRWYLLSCAPVDSRCGICGGPLSLALRGGADVPAPEAMAPTCHTTGAHADLYACAACGTIQQPALPAGAELLDLYRAMEDDALPRRGGRPPRDLAPAAAPRREGRAARPPARGRLRPRAAARRGAPPRLDGDRAGAGARRPRPRRVARPRRPRRAARGPRPGHRRRLRGDRDGRRDRAPRGPGRRAAGGRGAARSRRRAVRRHARPLLEDRAAGRRALVGLPARAHLPAARGTRSSGCCARPGSTRSSTSACGGRSPSATGRAASASARAGSAARSRACAPPGSGGRR